MAHIELKGDAPGISGLLQFRPETAKPTQGQLQPGVGIKVNR